MRKDAEERMASEIRIEYLTHGNLSSETKVTDEKTNKTRMKKNLWGYKKHLLKRKETVDVAIAKWVTETLHKVMESKKAMKAFCTALSANYPSDGNFFSLEQNIRGQIIEMVNQYGINNLEKILSKEIKKTKSIGQFAKEVANDKSIYETVSNYNITGLNPNFGQYGLMLQLFKDIDEASKLKEGSAKQLFDAFDRFMEDKEKNRLTAQ